MNLGMPEMIFLFVMALIIFGPKKLPEIGRQVGRALNEFKRASNEFKAQIETEISQIDLENAKAEIEKAKQQILPPVLAGTVDAGSAEPGVVPRLEGTPDPKAPDA